MENESMSSIFQKHFLLVRIVRSQWSGKIRDRKYERELAETAEAEVGSARVWKDLVKPEYKQVMKAWGKLHNYFYAHAYQWPSMFGQHFYLVPVTAYDDFIGRIREHKRNLENAEKDFFDSYEQAVEKEKTRKGKLFNENDYPTRAQVEKKFHLEIIVRPVPVISDILVSIADNEIEHIKTELKREESEMLTTFARESWQRLLEPVTAIIDRLTPETEDKLAGRDYKIFRDSLVSNLQEAVNTVRSFNVTQDKALENLLKEIEEKLCVENARRLRMFSTVRNDVKYNAQNIKSKIEAYL